MTKPTSELLAALAAHHVDIVKTWQHPVSGDWCLQLFQEVHPYPDGSGSYVTVRGKDLVKMYADLTAYFIHKTEVDIVNIFGTDLFTYLAGEMFLDKDGSPRTVKLTITDVVMDDLQNGRGGTEAKPVVSFKERDKKLVLNKTNAKAIAGLYGPETNDWKGQQIAITAEHGAWFGKKGVRVVVLDHLPANGNGKKKAAPTPPTTPDEIDFDDVEQGELMEGMIDGAYSD